MSYLALDETPFHSMSSVNLQSSIRKQAHKTMVPLKPDSPRTIEACLELGIRVEDLRQKTFEEFADNNVSDDILKLRYENYGQRYNRLTKEVMLKKKENIKYKREKQNAHINTNGSDSLKALTSPTSLKNMGFRSNGQLSPLEYNSARTQGGVFLTSLSPNSNTNYKKTLTLFRQSHNTLVPLKLEDSHGTDEEDNHPTLKNTFEVRMSHEVEKFNKMKGLKQKEAIETYEEEIKRVKAIEAMSMKEKRRLEFEKKK